MSDELRAAIRRLQGDDPAGAQAAFADIADMAPREGAACANELSRALAEEWADGALRTPRLLTLLGLTREPVPECVPRCLDLLRELAATPSPPPTDAALGAAAIVARTRPRALLPEIAAMQAGTASAQDIDRHLVQALPLLLAASSAFLHELPDSAFAAMARWLWHDCAVLDLMTVVDFAGLRVEESGADDPIVGLMIDLVERVPATEDQKRYAGQRLQEAGVGASEIDQLKGAWRAIRVAPAPNLSTAEPPAIADPAPPPPDPRVDEWVIAFAGADPNAIELARACIDEMFQNATPPAALAWWVAVTVDSLPPRRRRGDIEWALHGIATALRQPGEPKVVAPASLLVRWLDTPQLLSATGTLIVLELLSRQEPGVVVQRYLHRAVAVSSERAEMLTGGMWSALATAEPAAVLAVVSRWLAFGFGQSGFLELLLGLLDERIREQPALIDALAGTLASMEGTSANVIDIAHTVLEQLRRQRTEDLQP